MFKEQQTLDDCQHNQILQWEAWTLNCRSFLGLDPNLEGN